MKLIDADALMDKLFARLRDGECLYRIPPSAIDEAPTVNPEELRPKGKWIAETDRTGNYSHCSECGCRCRGYAPNYKYCPNCGAKMEE